MKKTYTEYLNELSGNRMDVLEELISSKYHKFRKFYKVVSKFSDEIAHIAYRFSDGCSLDIDITVNSSVDIGDFVDKIIDKVSHKYDVTCDVDTRVIYFSIGSLE